MRALGVIVRTVMSPPVAQPCPTAKRNAGRQTIPILGIRGQFLKGGWAIHAHGNRFFSTKAPAPKWRGEIVHSTLYNSLSRGRICKSFSCRIPSPVGPACCPASAVCCRLASSAAGDCRQELALAYRKSLPNKHLRTFLTSCRHTWHRLCSPKPSFRQLSKPSRRGLQSPNKVNEIRRIMLTGLKTTLHGPDLPNIIRPSLNDGRRNFGP